jgi:hypothetical protein
MKIEMTEDLRGAIESEIKNPTALNSREARVLRGRVLERKTLDTVAVRLGLSRERVRQLESSGLRKMKKHLAMAEHMRNVDLSLSIVDLNFGCRATNSLTCAGYMTLGELLKATERDLLLLPWFGQGSLSFVKCGLRKMGLSLADLPKPIVRRDSLRSRRLALLRKIENQAENLLTVVRLLAAE